MPDIIYVHGGWLRMVLCGVRVDLEAVSAVGEDQVAVLWKSHTPFEEVSSESGVSERGSNDSLCSYNYDYGLSLTGES